MLTLQLEGGRYDGMLFTPLDGRGKVNTRDMVIYLGRPDRAEWMREASRNPSYDLDSELGLIFAATSASPMPYSIGRCRDAAMQTSPATAEVYFRCSDGGWRTPGLAGTRSFL